MNKQIEKNNGMTEQDKKKSKRKSEKRRNQRACQNQKLHMCAREKTKHRNTTFMKTTTLHTIRVLRNTPFTGKKKSFCKANKTDRKYAQSMEKMDGRTMKRSGWHRNSTKAKQRSKVEIGVEEMQIWKIGREMK